MMIKIENSKKSSKVRIHPPTLYTRGEHLTWRGDLAVWLGPAAAASVPGAPCRGGSSLARDTLELKYCTKLFHQTVHALSARSSKTRRYTNAICCSLKIPPSKLSHGMWYPRVISPQGAFWEVCQSQPVTSKHIGKVVRGAHAAQILPQGNCDIWVFGASAIV